MNLKFLLKFLPEIKAYAHCDIPCGIYEPTPAKIAAVTVKKMVEMINSLPKEEPPTIETKNALSRMIQVKEEHAALCKKELLILWSDFFKPEHLEKFPQLHEVFWKAVKLCSKNKQSVDPQLAQQLIEVVDEIAKIFYEVKGKPEKFEAYKILTSQLY